MLLQVSLATFFIFLLRDGESTDVLVVPGSSKFGGTKPWRNLPFVRSILIHNVDGGVLMIKHAYFG